MFWRTSKAVAMTATLTNNRTKKPVEVEAVVAAFKRPGKDSVVYVYEIHFSNGDSCTGERNTELEARDAVERFVREWVDDHNPGWKIAQTGLSENETAA